MNSGSKVESESNLTVEQLREQYRNEWEARKKRRDELRKLIYQEASFVDKVKMIIRSWFEKD